MCSSKEEIEKISKENLDELDFQVIRACIYLLEIYNPKMPVQDFLEEILLKYSVVSDDLEIVFVKMFYQITDMNKFLNLMLENYKIFIKRQEENNERDSLIKMLMYLIIFKLKANSKSIIFERLNELSFSESLSVLGYLARTETVSKIAQSGCRVFDLDYVKEQILEPFNQEITLIKELFKILNKENRKMRAIRCPKNTKAITPELMKRKKSDEPHCRPPTPEICPPFQAQDIPITTYKVPTNIQEKFQMNKKINKEQLNVKIPIIEKSEKFYEKIKEIEMERKAQFRIPKPKTFFPDFKNPKVKVNSTTILRKGALIKQKEEEAKRKIEAITSGSYDPLALERLEAEARSKQYEEELEAMQMKHIKAQLMREQAAIAKKNTLLANREKIIKYKEEKEEIDKMIEEWREEELVRIKERVEMAQDIKMKAKEAQFLMIANNIKHAQDVSEESRLLMEEALRQRQEELDRKIALMREIKAIESMRPLKVKEFDPTETSGLGLMCEMSIAELRERLTSLRVHWHEALCKKRESIKAEKERYQNLIKSTQKMIQHNNNQMSICSSKSASGSLSIIKKSVSAAAVVVADTPKIQAMRRLLQEKREQLQCLDKEVKAAGLEIVASSTGNGRIRNNF